MSVNFSAGSEAIRGYICSGYSLVVLGTAVNPGTKSLDFRGLDSSRFFVSEGWNFQVRKEPQHSRVLDARHRLRLALVRVEHGDLRVDEVREDVGLRGRLFVFRTQLVLQIIM